MGISISKKYFVFVFIIFCVLFLSAIGIYKLYKNRHLITINNFKELKYKQMVD